MYSFGKRPPRALETFGVAGLLGEECRVFYSTLFTTQHVGQVADLLAARLKRMQPDELRLRALLLFTMFEAYRSQEVSEDTGALAEPMVIECGIDSEKIAVGVSFTLPENFTLDFQGAAERVRAGTYQDSFEELLAYLFSHAHRLVIRAQPAIRRVEILSVMGMAGKMEEEVLSGAHELEMIAIENTPSEAPKAAAYVELGDLDYAQLLKEDRPNALPSNTGEFLARAMSAAQLEEGTALSNAIQETIDSTKIRVTGVTEIQQDENVTIAGTTEQTKDEVTRIKADGAAIQDETAFRIESGSPSSSSGMIDAQAKLYEDRIQELQKKIAQLEAERGEEVSIVSSSPTGSEDPEESDEEDNEGRHQASGRGVKKMFKKIKLWPFKKGEEGEEEEGEAQEPDSDPDSASLPEIPSPERSSGDGSNPETAASSLMVEIQNGSLDRTISRAQKEAMEIKKELTHSKAKRWMDGLMGELVTEKSRLHELAKKLNLSIRQKELEFRNREQILHEELRRRDEMLKQKNTALNRTKEQLANATMTMERLKSAGMGGADDAHLKQKFANTQKILAATKEENRQLADKIEELRSMLNSAQLAAVKNRGPSPADFANLQNRMERVQRQAEEFKKVNQQLLERLTESKKERSPGALQMEEIKKRLDAAMQALAASRKDAESNHMRVEELQREETRLRRELDRANIEVKKLRSILANPAMNSKKPGSDSSSAA